MRVIKGLTVPVKAVTFSPDGVLLASAGEDGIVRVWDALTGEPRATMSLGAGGRFVPRFAPDSRHLVVATQCYGAGVWDALEGRLVKQLYPRSEFAGEAHIGFTPEGILVLARADKASGVWLFDTTTWEERGRWNPPEYGSSWNLIAIEPGAYRAALGIGLLVDVRTGAAVGRWGDPIQVYAGRGGSILAWCPRKPLLAVSNRGKTIDIVDPTTATAVTTLTSPTKYFEAFAFTPDGRHLIAVSNDRMARLYDTATWQARETLDWGIGPLKSTAVTADGSRAAAGGGGAKSGKVVIWDLD